MDSSKLVDEKDVEGIHDTETTHADNKDLKSEFME